MENTKFIYYVAFKSIYGTLKDSDFMEYEQIENYTNSFLRNDVCHQVNQNEIKPLKNKEDGFILTIMRTHHKFTIQKIQLYEHNKKQG